GVLFPHLHLDTAVGRDSADQRVRAVGHHDPHRNGWTWQNLEFGLSGRFNETWEAFGTYAATVSAEGKWQGVYEEWFVKAQGLELGWLGEFELRGGRFYNRFGIQNTYHPHGFDWVDQYLVNARMLGEDSMTTIGADITWRMPVPWLSQWDVALGVAPEPEAHDHAHEEGESEFDPEGAIFDSGVTMVNWTNVYHYTDFQQFRAGLSGAWGDNASGRSTQVYGAHFEYQWRENGLEAGGRYFRWRNEAMWRRWGAKGEAHAHEHGERLARATLSDFGFYSSALYGFSPQVEAGLRVECVTGSAEAGLDERFRLSPGVTYYLNAARSAKLRLQYNLSDSDSSGVSHGAWAQVSLTWGGPEVR
ncbi:MAG: hypothetical protein KDK99_22160, partial [Verrucomicrobiales bacterium]|nr:hypothetical protein [Verrucomicrobiales bacterium]